MQEMCLFEFRVQDKDNNIVGYINRQLTAS